MTERTLPATTVPLPMFDLHSRLNDYASDEATEQEARHRFLDLLAATDHCFWRDAYPAHFTASAWLVSRDGRRALLMHHRKLDRWLQPGGHADGNGDLPRVALREAEEESGLHGLRVDDRLFDLDYHPIPACGREPEHWHYDVRFVVQTTRSETFRANDESTAMRWVPVGEIVADSGIDASIRRMAKRWLGSTR